MTKSYDVYFGKIDGRNFVPGQEGETRLAETKTYGQGYGSQIYALLTEKDGRYYVRKYTFQPELDRIGAGRYDPDKLHVDADHVFTDYADAVHKLDEIALKLDEQHMEALVEAKGKIEGNKKTARDYEGFQNIERQKVIGDFIGSLLKTPHKLMDHFADANQKMDNARNWFIQRAANVYVAADHAIHLDPNDTEKRMGAVIAETIAYDTDVNHRFVVDYFNGVRQSAPTPASI